MTTIEAAIDQLVAVHGDGDVDAFDAGVAQLGQRLLSMAPDPIVSASGVLAAVEAIESLGADPAMSLGCCLTLAASNIRDGAVLRSVAASWLEHTSRAAREADIRTEAEDLREMAWSTIEVAALCSVIDLDPGSILEVVLAAAAATHLQPGAESAALDLLVLGARMADAFDLDGTIWKDALRSSVHSVVGAVTLGREPHPRVTYGLLVRAHELLGEHDWAQLARVSLAQGLLAEGVVGDAETLIRAARASPTVAPDHQYVIELLQAGALLHRGKFDEVARVAEWVLNGSPCLPHRLMACSLLSEVGDARGEPAFNQRAVQQVRALLPGPWTSLPEPALLTPILARAALLALEEDGDRGPADELLGLLGELPGPLPPVVVAYRARLLAAAAAARSDLDGQRAALADGITDLRGYIGVAVDQIAADRLLGAAAGLSGDVAALAVRDGDAAAALRASEAVRGVTTRSGRTSMRPRASAGTLARLDGVPKPSGNSKAATLLRDIIRRIRLTPLRSLATTGAQPEDDSLDALFEDLPEGWAVASIAAGGVMTLAMAGRGRQWCADLGRPGRVREAATHFTLLGADRPQPRTAAWRATADGLLATLHDVVARPLLEGLEAVGCDALVLSAPGAIAGLPLVAIRDGSATLADRLAGLAVVPSLALAAADLRRPSPAQGVLVAAAPDDRARLPAIEGRVVEGAWVSAGQLTRLEPMVDQLTLLEASPGRGIVHLAAHGSWDGPSAERSGLQLAGGELVDLAEMYAGWELEETDLVVLSACSSAVASFAASGEGISLASFALMAGARRVLASLWDVRDDASTLFMVDVHDRAARGVALGCAVLKAQRSLRDAGTEEVVARWDRMERAVRSDAEADAVLEARARAASTDHPYGDFSLWSPFVLTGLPGPILPVASVAVPPLQEAPP